MDDTGKKWYFAFYGYPFGIRDDCMKFQKFFNAPVKFLTRFFPLITQYLDDIYFAIWSGEKKFMVQRDFIL